MEKFTEKEVGAALTQLFTSLLGQLEMQGVLQREQTVQIFDRAAKALQQYPDDPINAKAALFVDMLSSQARKRN